MLANFRAGRARAFFKGSSITNLDGLDFAKSTLRWRVVERKRFWTGPVSSAEESGRAGG